MNSKEDKDTRQDPDADNTPKNQKPKPYLALRETYGRKAVSLNIPSKSGMVGFAINVLGSLFFAYILFRW